MEKRIGERAADDLHSWSCLQLMTSWNTAVYRYHGIFEMVYYHPAFPNTTHPYGWHMILAGSLSVLSSQWWLSTGFIELNPSTARMMSCHVTDLIINAKSTVFNWLPQSTNQPTNQPIYQPATEPASEPVSEITHCSSAFLHQLTERTSVPFSRLSNNTEKTFCLLTSNITFHFCSTGRVTTGWATKTQIHASF